MNAILAGFGVQADDLPAQIEHISYPTPVPGRVAHIDADFLSYQVSSETRDELDGIKPRRSFEDMQHYARAAAEELMKLSGATSYVCHVTPSGSNKGGRAAQAVTREYQATRQGKERPEFLDAIRAYLVQEMGGIAHLDQEADDGMAQANYNAVGPDGSWGNSNLSIIVSKDKDLRMVPGLHYDFDTQTVFCVGNAFGSIWIDDTKSSKTLKGWGTKFFWAQCLMGDTADNIRGLPFVMSSRGVKGTKGCGPVATFALLAGMNSDKECFQLVKELYTEANTQGMYEYTHWATGAVVTPTQALLGEMRLLWMRRNKNPDDVLAWLKETMA